MIQNLPESHEVFMQWGWPEFEPYYQELEKQPLTPDNVNDWLYGWSELSEVLGDYAKRLAIAMTRDTADNTAQERYGRYMDGIFPAATAADQALKQKLLASGLEPAQFEMPLRNFRAEIDLFRQENLELLAGEQKLSKQYDQIAGAQTVPWNGEELTVTQLRPVYEENDRSLRERAWRLSAERALQDREKINALWQQLLSLRVELARNAGKRDYRAYRWQQMLRFAYSPEDALRFDRAIEEAAVPAAARIYERRRRQMGLERLRPWDLEVDPLGRPPLHPFDSLEELKTGAAQIFHHVHPQLGDYFNIMVAEDLLDLENRKNKAPGAYCESLDVIRRPFIFANSVGLQDDVLTLLHESGHAFHVFETAHLPYRFQLDPPAEFGEVASTSMELLAAPYLVEATGGFYTHAQAARAHIAQLEESILFWPYMAVVDSFQHWVYENPQQAAGPENCDRAWAELWQRYMPGVDWSDLKDEMSTGWQRKLHILQAPFYYIEYGLARLGAVQVWAKSLKNPIDALEDYRQALALGGTVTLPQLFEAAGARLAFDPNTLRQAIHLMETTVQQLLEKYPEKA